MRKNITKYPSAQLRRIAWVALILLLFPSTTLLAGPILQIGVDAYYAGDGNYADYQASLTNPTETDTAIVYGDPAILKISGELQTGGPNTRLLGLGGQFGGGLDWTDTGINANNLPGASSEFAGKGALLLASVGIGDYSGLTVNGNAAFYTSAALPDFMPNSFNHAPLKDGIATQFLFFNIGNFTALNQLVNYDSETNTGLGEEKSVTVAGLGNLSFVHFDVIALATDTQGQSRIVTTLESNPNSKDVTWKQGVVPPDPQMNPVPEPASLAVFGFLALCSAGAGVRRRRLQRG